MKIKRVLLSVLIAGIVLGAWINSARVATAELIKYRNDEKLMEQYEKEGLYDRAISKCQEMLNYKDSESNWKKYVQLNKEKCQTVDDTEDDAFYDYMDVLNDAIKKVSDKSSMAVELANLYIERDKYEEAYSCLNYVKEHSKVNDEFENMYLKVVYSTQLEDAQYTEITALSNGNYVVSNGVNWSYLSEDGEESEDILGEWEYASPIGSDGVGIRTKKQKSQLVDKDNKVMGIFDFTVNTAGKYSEEKIPAKMNDKYYYYDSFAKQLLGPYEFASTFYDGKAAVKTDSNWYIINAKGEKVHKFEDIVVNLSGDYVNDDIMVAKKDGKYSLYDNDGNMIKNNIKYDAMDMYASDNLVAFKEGEKWGYVNKDGKVIIKPQYEQAKSFSNGIGAVCSGGKWGFIDESNELVIGCKYLDADYFNSEGKCFVKVENPYSDKGYSWQILSLVLGVK